MRQLSLLLENRRLLGREDFLVSPCNIEAIEWIDAFPDWYGVNALIVLGDKASGKTHISWLFSEKANAKVYNILEIKNEIFSDVVPINSSLVIDDIDKAIGDLSLEENLFHIINYAFECNTKLFFTSSILFNNSHFLLPDLKTRLLSFPVARIYPPDDDLLRSLLVKQFLDKGIILSPDVIEFIIKNIDRNPLSVQILVDKADLLSFEEKRNITIPFIKKIIEDI